MGDVDVVSGPQHRVHVIVDLDQTSHRTLGAGRSRGFGVSICFWPPMPPDFAHLILDHETGKSGGTAYYSLHFFY